MGCNSLQQAFFRSLGTLAEWEGLSWMQGRNPVLGVTTDMDSMKYQLFSWPGHCLCTLAGCIPSCTGVNSGQKARLVLKGFVGSGLGGCIEQNTGMLCLHSTSAELWQMHELIFLPTQLWVMTVSLWSFRGSYHLLINISSPKLLGKKTHSFVYI